MGVCSVDFVNTDSVIGASAMNPAPRGEESAVNRSTPHCDWR